VFRRRSTATSEALDTNDAAPGDSADSRPRPGLTPPKGVPTPKRNAAQANRRQPYQAPADRKAAARQSRAQDRSERLRRTEAYQRGEQWAMPRKDVGPVRALARDVVDARRSLGEFYLIVFAGLIATFVLPKHIQPIGEAVVLAVLLLMAADSWYVGTKVKRLAATRYPGESTRGLMRYTFVRCMSLRRMRMPRPRVSRGDKV
jgi:hypothetical protein